MTFEPTRELDAHFLLPLHLFQQDVFQLFPLLVIFVKGLEPLHLFLVVVTFVVVLKVEQQFLPFSHYQYYLLKVRLVFVVFVDLLRLVFGGFG